MRTKKQYEIHDAIKTIFGEASFFPVKNLIFQDFLRFESMLSNYESSKETKIKMVKKINNSFSNLNFQIDKLTSLF